MGFGFFFQIFNMFKRFSYLYRYSYWREDREYCRQKLNRTGEWKNVKELSIELYVTIDQYAQGVRGSICNCIRVYIQCF